MLPLSAGKQKLSDLSREKLDDYFRRFCEGENGKRYGIGHIVYACHASFPMLLSPGLANLLWLNFKNFALQNTPSGIPVIQTIDPVTVSDFLLSSLVRPVSSRQYEVIPEIRTYLLYLLKNGRWFMLYGITSYGSSRLNGLASFLLQYLDDKQSQHENNASGFSQVNRWAALAWLQPDRLALSMGEAFKSTFKEKEDNELGQLRLNLLMDRFSDQYELDLKEEGAPTKAFINLHTYSKANNAQLFERGMNVVSNILAGLDEDFIGQKNSGTSLIELPVEKAIGERLDRKKKKIRRVVSLLIGIDEYASIHTLRGGVNSVKLIKNFLQHLNPEEFQISVRSLTDQYATLQQILTTIKNIYAEAYEEDMCLIYFSGHGMNKAYNENWLIPVDYPQPANNETGISNEVFYHAIQAANSKKCQTVFILDSQTGYYTWVNENDIFIGGVRHTKQIEFTYKGSTTTAFARSLKEILEQTSGKITYYDLYLWLNFKMENDYKISPENPVLITANENLDTYFLTKTSAPPHDYFLIAFNKHTEDWQLIHEAFRIPELDGAASVYDYNNEQKEITGRLISKKDNVCFAGPTTNLVNQKIYKVFVHRRVLPFQLQYAEGSNQDNTGDLIDRLKAIHFDRLSNWERLVTDADAPYLPYGKLLIKKNNTLTNPAYEVTFQFSGYQRLDWNSDSTDTLNEPVGLFHTTWNANSKDELVESIGLFSTFHYFRGLQMLKPDFNEHFKATVTLNWDKSVTPPQPIDQPLILDHRSLNTALGSIQFYPVSLQISSREQYPLFYAVYLVLDDFTIKKVSGNNHTKVDNESTVNIIIDEQRLFEKILLSNIRAEIKVLFSRDAIRYDFSQNRKEIIYR